MVTRRPTGQTNDSDMRGSPDVSASSQAVTAQAPSVDRFACYTQPVATLGEADPQVEANKHQEEHTQVDAAIYAVTPPTDPCKEEGQQLAGEEESHPGQPQAATLDRQKQEISGTPPTKEDTDTQDQTSSQANQVPEPGDLALEPSAKKDEPEGGEMPLTEE